MRTVWRTKKVPVVRGSLMEDKKTSCMEMVSEEKTTCYAWSESISIVLPPAVPEV